MMRRLLFIGLLAMLAMMGASAQMLTQVSGTVLDSTTGKVLVGASVTGGPVLPIQLDFVKQRDFLLNEEELDCYQMKMEVPTTIGDRHQLPS